MEKKIETPECMRCGHPLELVSSDELDDGMYVNEYHCPYCGVIENYYSCGDEDKDEYAFYNNEVDDTLGGSSHGYDGLCPICGSHIVWSSDFMRSEVLGDIEGQEYDYSEGRARHPEFFDENGCLKDDSLVSSVTCPHCGGSIDIIECKPSEYHNYPAYAEETNADED